MESTIKQADRLKKSFIISVWAFFWGDPHITTLDAKTYTFNGHGEYVMLIAVSGSDSVEIQARTGLALDKDNKTINATVFTAFVVKNQLNNTVQAELNVDGSRDSEFFNFNFHHY